MSSNPVKPEKRISFVSQFGSQTKRWQRMSLMDSRRRSLDILVDAWMYGHPSGCLDGFCSGEQSTRPSTHRHGRVDQSTHLNTPTFSRNSCFFLKFGFTSLVLMPRCPPITRWPKEAASRNQIISEHISINFSCKEINCRAVIYPDWIHTYDRLCSTLGGEGGGQAEEWLRVAAARAHED